MLLSKHSVNGKLNLDSIIMKAMQGNTLINFLKEYFTTADTTSTINRF